MGKKTSNRSGIPLCIWDHRLKDDSYHHITPEDRWADYHNLDLPELVLRLNTCFDLMRANRGRASQVVIDAVFSISEPEGIEL